MNDRQTAFKILNKIEKSKAYSNLALDSYLQNGRENIYSSAFVSYLVYGVTERLITLDYVISLYLTKPVKKLKPEVLTALRLGCFQLLFADSVPDSAAVNESVKLVKNNGCAFASGLVNSVLRKIAQNGITYPQTDDGIFDMSIRYSCPESLVRRFVGDYGKDDTEEFLKHSLLKPKICARVNTLKTDTASLISRLSEKGVSAVSSDIVPDHIVFDGFTGIENSAEFNEGLFHIQDLSSAVCVHSLELKEGMTLVDACSAPGGKSFTAAEIMNNKGIIYSFDIYESRVGLIKEGADRLGIDIIKASVCDASKVNEELIGKADRVLCDVPCSCLGTIGRKPEIKYKDFGFVDKLSQLQYNILSSCAEYPKQDGLLVYSTCSLSKAENENVCDRFLDNNKNYVKVGEYRTLMPHKDGTDGFFTAKFRRK